jgi:hypothetical protein
LADEDKRYQGFLRGQPCAACGGDGPCEVHHAESGTTYSPELPIPAKAIPGARARGAQRSHDHCGIPMHGPTCHRAEWHGKKGRFKGWTRERRDAWEADQIRKYRRRYAMQFPSRVPTVDATEGDQF